jgi:hypothetical protein
LTHVCLSVRLFEGRGARNLRLASGRRPFAGDLAVRWLKVDGY